MEKYTSAYEMEKIDEQDRLEARSIILFLFMVANDWLKNFVKRLFHVQKSK